MESEREKELRERENAREDSQERRENAREHDEPYIGKNKDVSGNDRIDEARKDRRFHEQHGNRKYESHKNHSSADDQPQVDTGPGI